MRNLDFWKSEREKAVNESGLWVLRTQSEKGPCLMMWRPKGKKPFANYRFKTVEQREEYIKKQIDGHEKRHAEKMLRNAARKGTPEMLAKIGPGTIFHGSWGYDQTQCDYYEVIERKKRHVTVRRVIAEPVEGSSGFMSDSRVPVAGAFMEDEKPFKKLVQFAGTQAYIAMDYGWCNLWDGKPKYCSWYA